MNTKWLSLAAIIPAWNDATRTILTQPLHHCITRFT
jgi:DNA-binding FrmR family transcriptional regulator